MRAQLMASKLGAKHVNFGLKSASRIVHELLADSDVSTARVKLCVYGERRSVYEHIRSSFRRGANSSKLLFAEHSSWPLLSLRGHLRTRKYAPRPPPRARRHLFDDQTLFLQLQHSEH